MLKLFLLSGVLLSAAPAPEIALEPVIPRIIGPARVIDGDTIAIGPVSIRLKAVDAAERGTELGKPRGVFLFKISMAA